MQEMQLISCIRFSMQILIAESVFLWGGNGNITFCRM